MTTSGTTGPPKRVLLGHDSVVASIDSALNKIRSGGASSRTRIEGTAPKPRGPMPNLVPMPLALWSGIFNTLFASRVGAPVILLHPFVAADFASAVKRFQLKSTVLAPPMMTMLADGASIPSPEPLRFVRSSTAPLSPHEARRFRDRFGVTVLNSYGQTGVPDRRVGEMPWAWVVLAPGAELDADALKQRCREELAPYAVPVGFEVIDALPWNDVGKVLRRELVAGFGSDEEAGE